MRTGRRKGSTFSRKPASKSGRFLSGTYRSSKTGNDERYDSSYELRRFVALDASQLVKRWTKKHGLEIRYKMLGRNHRYLPDILVEYHDGRRFLEEIKGRIFNRLQFLTKNAYAASWCQDKRCTFRVIFREHLELVD